MQGSLHCDHSVLPVICVTIQHVVAAALQGGRRKSLDFAEEECPGLNKSSELCVAFKMLLFLGKIKVS